MLRGMSAVSFSASMDISNGKSDQRRKRRKSFELRENYMRLACDTGGTFTDLIVENVDRGLQMYKAATTPDDPVRGVLDAIQLAATATGQSLAAFLAGVTCVIHGTTHAINAIITGNTAKTALLATAGHRDILVLREGGRIDPFNSAVPYPEPFVPRALTFEIPERINSAGDIVKSLNDAAVIETLGQLREQKVESVAVCLLWSIVNPIHEKRIGALIAEHLPGVPYTLSHALNPVLREYRRASAAAIDASLKPSMTSYLGSLAERLRDAGFAGRLLVLTSQGGVMDASDIAKAPIHAINSGPSLAPVAGRHFGALGDGSRDIVVADTGGTTYDVSLVRGGRIPLTRETWIGQPSLGHITGFPSVDVKSVGAGGGSVARVDDGGVLHVGPESAGAKPGPACYGQGGTSATVTDACVVLGYLDANYFLGGTMRLDLAAARNAIAVHVARPLRLEIEQAAAAVVRVATENMVQAIAGITVNQGIDPARAVLIGGGGAAGLNSVFIARRLGIATLVIPEVGASLSAAGALMSEVASDHRATSFVSTRAFDYAAANKLLDTLETEGLNFLRSAGFTPTPDSIDFTIEARYEHQVWEIDVPLTPRRFRGESDVARMVEDFHALHEQIFSFRDPKSAVELIGWSARAHARTHEAGVGRLQPTQVSRAVGKTRRVYFDEIGFCDAAVYDFEHMAPELRLSGPAVIESPFTTIIIDPPCRFDRTLDGSIVIDIFGRNP
jgi:N-methylhydantoinase A